MNHKLDILLKDIKNNIEFYVQEEGRGKTLIGTCGDCEYRESIKPGSDFGKCINPFAVGNINRIEPNHIEFFIAFGCIHWKEKEK